MKYVVSAGVIGLAIAAIVFRHRLALAQRELTRTKWGRDESDAAVRRHEWTIGVLGVVMIGAILIALVNGR